MITIIINGEANTREEPVSIEKLLKQLKIDPAIVVIEYNQTIIKKVDFDKIICQDNDQLEIAQFMGGG